MRELPFSVYDAERDVFVGRPSTEVQKHGLVVARFLDDPVRGSLGLVDEIWVEYIELLGRKYDILRMI